ncbi:MAG: hypothetical protein QG587_1504 [Chloroflexota bacterium]|nr:hypothetical protein [Chloroflexota bacterium]
MNGVRCFASVLAVLVVVAGCTTSPGTDAGRSRGPSGNPASEVTTQAPGSTAVSTPAPSPPPVTTPRPSPSPVCPSDGDTVTFEAFAALPAECASIELSLAGWWDRRRESDLPEAGPLGLVLRERIPTGRTEEGLDFGPRIPLDTNELETDTATFEGRWTELRVRAVQDDEHCYWAIRTDEAVSPSFPPAWTCPRFARVLAAKVADPPAGALAACPDLSSVIPVADFVRYPRDCFGDKAVEIAGWLDTHDVVGGWEAPWEIKPGWLWSLAIGPVLVLAPTSDANDWENLRLHVRPGTAIEKATQNRRVILRGHYARADEYRSCHYEYPADWYGKANPAAGIKDDADAQADCAGAFVAESVRAGAPN